LLNGYGPDFEPRSRSVRMAASNEKVFPSLECGSLGIDDLPPAFVKGERKKKKNEGIARSRVCNTPSLSVHRENILIRREAQQMHRSG